MDSKKIARINELYKKQKEGILTESEREEQAVLRLESTSKTCTNICDRMQETSVQEHLQKLPLAMAYVPMQKFGKVYEPARGFQLGTIFPELCKPFPALYPEVLSERYFFPLLLLP